MKNLLKLTKTIAPYSLLLIISLVLTACSKDHLEPDSDSDSNPVLNGIPESLSEYYLNIYDGSSLLVCAKHIGESVMIENFKDVDYSEFKPDYGYSVQSNSVATYFLQFTRRMYLSSLGSYSYGMWTLNLELKFNTSDYLSGTYSGTQRNSSMTDTTKKISGKFTITTTPPDAQGADNNGNVDFSYLTKGQWRHKYNDSGANFSFVWKFNDDGSYSKTYDGVSETAVIEKGTYKKDTSKNIISMSPNGATAYTTTVTYLDSNKMKIIAGGEDRDSGIETEYTNEEYNGVTDISINISKPEIVGLTKNSATVKGTILGNVTFTKRGVCYSTTKNPTTSDNVVNVTSDVANVTLTNLYEGTTYYVKLFGEYNGQTYYGDEGSFTTEGSSVGNIILKQTVWGPHAVRIEAKLPNNISNYGLCWGTNPHPKITDNYLKEKNRQTVWDFDVNTTTEFYVRAYHIDGSNVVYYEDSEIRAQTIRDIDGFPNIDLDLKKFSKGYVGSSDRPSETGYCLYDLGFTCKFANIPEGTYEVTFKDNTWTSVYRGYLKCPKATKYSDGGSGNIVFEFPSSSGYVMATDYIWIRFKDLDSGNIFYSMWYVWSSGRLELETDASFSHLGTWGNNIMKE